MSSGNTVVTTAQGTEVSLSREIPIPCFRCGICCIYYQPPLCGPDIQNIASGLGIPTAECIASFTQKVPTREGYLLRRTEKGCIFLTWDDDGRARCSVHDFRPRACRDWVPSLAKPECLEGLARLKCKGQVALLDDLLGSDEGKQELLAAVKEALVLSRPCCLPDA